MVGDCAFLRGYFFMTYKQMLRDPLWIQKRNLILRRDNNKCVICYRESQESELDYYEFIEYEKQSLAVHHKFYTFGHKPWEYDNMALMTLCEDHHDDEDMFRKKVFTYLKKSQHFAAKQYLTSNRTNKDLFFACRDLLNDTDECITIGAAVNQLLDVLLDPNGKNFSLETLDLSPLLMID